MQTAIFLMQHEAECCGRRSDSASGVMLSLLHGRWLVSGDSIAASSVDNAANWECLTKQASNWQFLTDNAAINVHPEMPSAWLSIRTDDVCNKEGWPALV